MEPLKMLEEGVKSKSWPMVRAALKELQEQPKLSIHPDGLLGNFPVGDGIQIRKDITIGPDPVTVTPEVRHRDRPEVFQPRKDSNPVGKPTSVTQPTHVDQSFEVTFAPVQQKTTQNLFQDDGTAFAEDKSWKPATVTPRERGSYVPRFLNCAGCGKSIEVDPMTFSYHTKGAEKGDPPIPYVCQRCM